MGYREFSQKVGCGVATVKAWMDAFEKEGMVERSRNAKGTICKLKKWSEYQETRTLTERSRNADGTLTEPNKKVEKVKNEKKPTTWEELLTWLRRQDSIANPEGWLKSLIAESSESALKKSLVGVESWPRESKHK